MADESTNFPTLPAKHWWALRERLKRSVPPVMTPEYLETAIGSTERVAKDMMPQLKVLGLISDDCRPTERTEDWRHDESYAQACAEIRDDVYPEDLLHAVPDPAQEPAAAERWFARKKKVGTNVAGKMARVYQLVVEADPAKAPDAAVSTTPRKATDRPTKRQNAVAEKVEDPKSTATPPVSQPGGTGGVPPAPTSTSPTLHIDIQIHIASDASATQIDQIFASMAKHLYSRGAEANE